MSETTGWHKSYRPNGLNDREQDQRDVDQKMFNVMLPFLIIGKLKPETIQAIVDEMAKKGEASGHILKTKAKEERAIANANVVALRTPVLSWT